MNSKQVNVNILDEMEVQIILIKSDLGASRRGAALGPDAIRKAASDKGSVMFRQFPVQVLQATTNAAGIGESEGWGKHLEQIATICEHLTGVVYKESSQNSFLLLLSGDHSMAAGTLAGIKKRYPEEPIGVVWIDAHADLHSPYTSPSGNLHGMPLAAALGLDSLHLQRNQPDEHTKQQWERFKQLGGISPKFKPENLVYVGLRQTEQEEDSLIDELKIPVFTIAEVRAKGIAQVAASILEQLKDCKHLVVSFDVDSLDPTVSKATGTPVADGLTQEEALELLRILCADKRTRCLEIVEINPELEQGNKMGEIGFEIVNNILDIKTHQASHAD
ncbi:MAG: arginase [Bacteroidia bacterium]|nr:arginase [Bacteroidia bacterium]